MNDHASFDRRALAVIVLLAVLIFANTLSVPFQWDGIEFIADNPIIHDLGNFTDPAAAEDFRWYGAFKSRYVGYLSFAVNYAMHGVKPLGYHLFNIAVHAINSLLIYFMVVFLFASPALRDTRLAERAGSVALWAALIFAAHPVQSEAVTYIFQRHASLVGLFYLGSLVAWLIWRTGVGKEGGTGARAWWWYALALVSAILAMKTKENAFTLPVMIVIVEALFFNSPGKIPKGKSALLLLPFIATMAIVPLTLIGADRPVGEILSGLGQRAGQYASLEGGGREYMLTQVRVVATYLRLFIFPVNQNLDYDYPSPEQAGLLPIASALILHLVLWATAALMIVKGRRDRLIWHARGEFILIGFAIIWFYLALIVESSVIYIPMAIAEYRMYVPLAGLAVGASVGLHMALEGRTKQVALALLVGMLAVLAVERNALWKDSVALWADAAQKSPLKARPWYNLGVFTEAGGDASDRELAVAHYQRAISLDPGYLDAHYNMGVALERLERYDESVLAYKRVLALDPARADAVNNLGVVYERTGRRDKAAEAYQESIRMHPEGIEPRLNLGGVLLRDGKYKRARAVIEEAIALGGIAVSAYEDLGMAFFKMGRLEEASEAYRKAVALAPLSQKAIYNLATVSLRRGEFEQAAAQFRNALAINEDYADAHMGLGATLEKMWMYAEALHEFEAAVALEPDSPIAHFRLGTFLDVRGMKARAIQEYMIAIDLDPAHADALNNLGTIYNEARDIEQAQKYLNLAVKADPAHADAHNNLGVVFYNLRQHKDAYAEFRQAVALAPRNKSFRSNLIAIKRVLGIKN